MLSYCYNQPNQLHRITPSEPAMQNPEQSEQPNAPDDFPAYPAYKPSGIEWLGDIPSHWDVRRGKYIFKTVNVRSQNGDEELLTVSAENGVIPRESANVTMFKAESYVGYKLCWPGDLVINSLWAWAKGLAVSQHHGIVSSAYGVYRPLPQYEEYATYLHYLVRSHPFQWELQVRSKGIWISRLKLTDRAFLDAPLPLPPPSEQRAIAAYLDRKGAIARRYAHVARHIIDTLRELRQVEIHDAVTRGLNEDIPLKPSGVEWLGDVPEHWDVRRLRYVAKMRTSNVDKHTKMNENPVRLCNYVDVYHNERISADLDFMRATATDREIERFRLERGDVIITKDSETWNDIGVPALVEYTADDLVCGYHLALLRPFESVMTGAYLLRALQAPTVASQFHIQANGVTRYGLTQNAIKSVHIPVPPLPEQRAIAEYLDAKTAAIDAAIAHYERMAELVAEYWTVLVADAVTGRIDLRQTAAE